MVEEVMDVKEELRKNPLKWIPPYTRELTFERVFSSVPTLQPWFI